MGGAEDTIDADVAVGRALYAVLTVYPKILIVAVHGASIGWGCTQLSAFDLIYANQSAFFQTPFASLGIVPDVALPTAFQSNGEDVCKPASAHGRSDRRRTKRG
jgi:enoyl-CoA hydratase/carnithine racemase